MKKFLITILGAIALLTGTVSSFADSDIIEQDEQTEMDFQTISIYKEVDDAIMSVENIKVRRLLQICGRGISGGISNE